MKSFIKGVNSNIDNLIKQGIKSGKIKRCLNIPSKIDGKVGYIQVIENGAIDKLLQQQNINLFDESNSKN